MTLQKTDKQFLSNEDILQYISDYEIKVVPHLNDLWEYYKGKNVKILSRKTPDPNNPDNKIVISYGRKIITTYTGYGYRPKYITYKPNNKKTSKEIDNIENDVTVVENPIEKKYCNEIQNVYNSNNEHIKTNRAGRNMAIFGCNYELLYIDSEIKELSIKAVPKFFTVDPREMIVLYNYDPEPKIIMAIRYYKMSDNEYKVEVYYKNKIERYIRYREQTNNQITEWRLKTDLNNPSTVNFYSDVPIVAFYRGDEMQSIIENVLIVIDAYDVLMSDSMNEFDRFAFAYLIMKRISLTNPIDKKDPTKSANALKELKRRRVFEGLDKDADVKFLTKDIPTAFIEYMAKKLKEEIHLQSHVPDFTQLTGALSGAAIDRLLFDFENLVSSDEADFDVALIRRGTLITDLLLKLNRIPDTSDFATMINISHKRNLPLDRNSFAELAEKMSRAGFSRRRILENMPEDMVPDVEAELEEEKKEAIALTGLNNLEGQDLTEYDEEGNAITDEYGNPLENKEEGD
jgi:SPP1 family phage portal protein